MTPAREALVAAVRTNCAISDARHAREMTMCTYLLAMREQCRWQRGYTLDAALPRAEVGAWLSEREAQWDDVAHGDYRPLPIDGALVEPFAVAAINAAPITSAVPCTTSDRTLCGWCAPMVIATEMVPGPTVSGSVNG